MSTVAANDVFHFILSLHYWFFIKSF